MVALTGRRQALSIRSERQVQNMVMGIDGRAASSAKHSDGKPRSGEYKWTRVHITASVASSL